MEWLDDFLRWLLAILFTIIFILSPDQHLGEFQQPVARYEPGPTLTATPAPTPKPTDRPEKPRHQTAWVTIRRASHNIQGKASWHATGRSGRYAAACFNLRKAIGPGWRGTPVIISYRRKILGVVLNDWCGSKDKLIDLSDEAFRYFAPLSRGVIKVGVGW